MFVIFSKHNSEIFRYCCKCEYNLIEPIELFPFVGLRYNQAKAYAIKPLDRVFNELKENKFELNKFKMNRRFV